MAIFKQPQATVEEVVPRKRSRRWVWFGLAALIVITAIVVPIAVIFSRRRGQSVPKANIIVPLYIYPDGNAWDPLITAANTRSDVNFTVIINPNNGPGTSLDSNYVNGIKSLNGLANVRTIGYVPLNETFTPVNQTLQKIQTYANWSSDIAMHGIFFDEAPYRDFGNGEQAYISTIRAAVQASGLQEKIIVYNPGVMPDNGFYKSSDIVVGYEGAYDGLKNAVAVLDHVSVNRTAYSMIVHTIPSGVDLGGVVNTLATNAGYVFATSNNGMGAESPYTNFSSIWTSFVGDMP